MNTEGVIPLVSAIGAVSDGGAGLVAFPRSKMVATGASRSAQTTAASFASFASPTRILSATMQLPSGSPQAATLMSPSSSSVFGGSRPLLGSPLASTASTFRGGQTPGTAGLTGSAAAAAMQPVPANELPSNVKLAGQALVNQLLSGAGAAPVSDQLPYFPPPPAGGVSSLLSMVYLDSSLTHDVLLSPSKGGGGGGGGGGDGGGEHHDNQLRPVSTLLHFRLRWPGVRSPLHLHVRATGQPGARLTPCALLEAACADLAYLCEAFDAEDFALEEAQEALAELLTPPLRYRVMAEGTLLALEDDEFLMRRGRAAAAIIGSASEPLQVVFLPPPQMPMGPAS